MLYLTGLPVVSQTGGQCRSQPQPPLGGFEQNRSAIGTALPLIKRRDHRSIKDIWKKETLCYGMFAQAKASFLVSNPPSQRICTIARPSVFLKSRILRANGPYWQAEPLSRPATALLFVGLAPRIQTVVL